MTRPLRAWLSLPLCALVGSPGTSFAAGLPRVVVARPAGAAPASRLSMLPLTGAAGTALPTLTAPALAPSVLAPASTPFSPASPLAASPAMTLSAAEAWGGAGSASPNAGGAAASPAPAAPAGALRNLEKAAPEAGAPVKEREDDGPGSLSSLFDGAHPQLPAVIPRGPESRETIASAEGVRDDLLKRSRVRLKEARRESRLYFRIPEKTAKESGYALRVASRELSAALRRNDFVAAESLYQALGARLDPDRFESPTLPFFHLKDETVHTIRYFGGLAMIALGATLTAGHMFEASLLAVGAGYSWYGETPWRHALRPLPLLRRDARAIKYLAPNVPGLTSPFTRRRRRAIDRMERGAHSRDEVKALALLAVSDPDPRNAQLARSALNRVSRQEELAALDRESAERLRLLALAPPAPDLPRRIGAALSRAARFVFTPLIHETYAPEQPPARLLAADPHAGLPAEAAARLDAVAEAVRAIAPRLDSLPDARRLVEKHLPALLEAYRRIKPDQRGERDLQGLTADERLTQGLGLVKAELDSIRAGLSQADRDALEIQARFLESRYGHPPR